MDLIIRAAIIYLVLFAILRVSGNRQFSQLTAFDLVLLLIISEATQNALIGDDFSVTAAVILIVTLVGIDILLSEIKKRSQRADLFLEGVPVLLMNNGELVKENMDHERVDESDILAAAREIQGLESLESVKFAVLERNGKISIIPWRGDSERGQAAVSVEAPTG